MHSTGIKTSLSIPEIIAKTALLRIKKEISTSLNVIFHQMYSSSRAITVKQEKPNRRKKNKPTLKGFLLLCSISWSIRIDTNLTKALNYPQFWMSDSFTLFDKNVMTTFDFRLV